MLKHVRTFSSSFLSFENKHIWFIGGFILGLTLVSIGHAALPNVGIAKALPNPNVVTEIQSGKVAAPDLDGDFEKLTNIESKYAESKQQQERLKRATSEVAGYDSQLDSKQ